MGFTKMEKFNSNTEDLQLHQNLPPSFTTIYKFKDVIVACVSKLFLRGSADYGLLPQISIC